MFDIVIDNGDVVLYGTNNVDVLVSVDSKQLMLQLLLHIIHTQKGSLKYNRSFGFDTLKIYNASLTTNVDELLGVISNELLMLLSNSTDLYSSLHIDVAIESTTGKLIVQFGTNDKNLLNVLIDIVYKTVNAV